MEKGRTLVQLSRKVEMPAGRCKVGGVRRKEFTPLWSNGRSIKKEYACVVAGREGSRKSPVRPFLLIQYLFSKLS